MVQQARRDAKRGGPFIEAGGGVDGNHELGGILVAERARKVAGFEEQGATLVRIVGDEGGGENGEVEDDDARHAALACEREPNRCVLPRGHRVYPRADLRGCRVEERGDDREVLGFGATGTLEPVRDHLVECESPGGVGPNSGRHDSEVRAGNGAEALFRGKGLVAQPQRDLPVSPVRGAGGGHERDRGAGMLGGAGQREQGGRVEDHDVVDLRVATGDLAEEPEGEVGVLGVERMGHCREQVVVLASEPRTPLDLSRPAHVTSRGPANSV